MYDILKVCFNFESRDPHITELKLGFIYKTLIHSKIICIVRRPCFKHLRFVSVIWQESVREFIKTQLLFA